MTDVEPNPVDVLSAKASRDDPSEPKASWHRSASLVHSRRSHRVPFSGPLGLRGLDEALEPVDEPLTATARDISGDGISFRHDGPLPYRFVELTYDTARGPVTRRAKLTWCRYSIDGFYVSGGRFLHQS
jgi:hypothetical protein